jgi:hypothetical protein
MVKQLLNPCSVKGWVTIENNADAVEQMQRLVGYHYLPMVCVLLCSRMERALTPRGVGVDTAWRFASSLVANEGCSRMLRPAVGVFKDLLCS